MSPEIFRVFHDDIKGYDMSADIFSLGVLILDFWNAKKREIQPIEGKPRPHSLVSDICSNHYCAHSVVQQNMTLCSIALFCSLKIIW